LGEGIPSTSREALIIILIPETYSLFDMSYIIYLLKIIIPSSIIVGTGIAGYLNRAS
jgi:hypothetical protein